MNNQHYSPDRNLADLLQKTNELQIIPRWFIIDALIHESELQFDDAIKIWQTELHICQDIIETKIDKSIPIMYQCLQFVSHYFLSHQNFKSTTLSYSLQHRNFILSLWKPERYPCTSIGYGFLIEGLCHEFSDFKQILTSQTFRVTGHLITFTDLNLEDLNQTPQRKNVSLNEKRNSHILFGMDAGFFKSRSHVKIKVWGLPLVGSVLTTREEKQTQPNSISSKTQREMEFTKNIGVGQIVKIRDIQRCDRALLFHGSFFLLNLWMETFIKTGFTSLIQSQFIFLKCLATCKGRGTQTLIKQVENVIEYELKEHKLLTEFSEQKKENKMDTNTWIQDYKNLHELYKRVKTQPDVKIIRFGYADQDLCFIRELLKMFRQEIVDDKWIENEKCNVLFELIQIYLNKLKQRNESELKGEMHAIRKYMIIGDSKISSSQNKRSKLYKLMIAIDLFIEEHEIHLDFFSIQKINLKNKNWRSEEFFAMTEQRPSYSKSSIVYLHSKHKDEIGSKISEYFMKLEYREDMDEDILVVTCDFPLAQKRFEAVKDVSKFRHEEWQKNNEQQQQTKQLLSPLPTKRILFDNFNNVTSHDFYYNRKKYVVGFALVKNDSLTPTESPEKIKYVTREIKDDATPKTTVETMTNPIIKPKDVQVIPTLKPNIVIVAKRSIRAKKVKNASITKKISKKKPKSRSSKKRLLKTKLQKNQSVKKRSKSKVTPKTKLQTYYNTRSHSKKLS